jgi:hypothetical protein
MAALCVAFLVPSLTVAQTDAEHDAVVRVVTDAYVDGVHNFRDAAAIRQGFHPDFEMLVLRDGKLEKTPLETWIAALEERNAKEPPPSRESGQRSTKASFPLVEIAGTAALVRVEIERDGKHVFTDFLNLYKFADGWKIVGKTFYRYP